MKLDMSQVGVEVSFKMPLRHCEPDEYLLKYDIIATYPKELKNNDRKEKIVVASAQVVQLDSDIRDTPLVEACDAYSRDALNLYYTLFNRDGELTRPPLDTVIYGDICYMKHFAVEPEFQQHGLGSELIEWIIKYLCCYKGALIIQLCPLEVSRQNDTDTEVKFIDFPELQERLRKFFKKQGFFPLWASPYMYRVTEWKKGIPAIY